MSAERGGALSWSVSALLLAISDALQARFAAVTVRGELSGFMRAGSGHCYFTLKDADGQPAAIRCAMFRRAASQLTFTPRDGQQVEVRGRLALYEPRGELQMVVESMRAGGMGSLYEEFLRLKAALEAQGLFAAERKRELPSYPRCMALVTSPSGAALHDVLTALSRRAPQVAVHLYPSLVQGAEAPAALVRALAQAGQDPDADLVLLCRGGGSLEDLWSFNDERVVRAVAACPLPVVVGVGHETDVTLADLAADLRAATPTAAAELAAPERDALFQALGLAAQRARRSMDRRLDAQAQRLDLLAMRLQRPGQLAAAQRLRLQHSAARLHRLVGQAQERAAQGLVSRSQRLRSQGRQSLSQAQADLAQRAARLHALDPRQVLARGYAWVTDESGQAVTQARGLQPGQRLQAVWSDGEVAVRVEPPDQLF